MQDRPTRCISNHSDSEKIKDLSMVSLERETAPVHMSTFWPQTLFKNFHKGSETPLGLPQSSGSSTAGIIIIASFKTTESSKTSRHQKDTPPVPSKKLQVGCMAHFRETLTKKGFSQKVSDILLSSWKKKLPVSIKVLGKGMEWLVF